MAGKCISMQKGVKIHFSATEVEKYILVLKRWKNIYLSFKEAKNYNLVLKRPRRFKELALKRRRPKEAKKLIDKWNSSGIPREVGAGFDQKLKENWLLFLKLLTN